MLPLTDTHCHLNFDTFDSDRSNVLERAWESGLQRILNPGVDVETSRSALGIAESQPAIYAAVGVHPEAASTWNEAALAELRDLASRPKVVAIGEIGLDYYREDAPPALQKEAFQAQLELAGEVGLPVVVHSRQAMEDLLSILRNWCNRLRDLGNPLSGRPGVLHSFEGSLEAAQEAMRLNFYIGVSGPVTFKNAPDRQAIIATLPLEHLLIETDAPFLSPHPLRGRRNEPANVRLIAEKIADLHHQSISSVAQITTENAAKLFAWGV